MSFLIKWFFIASVFASLLIYAGNGIVLSTKRIVFEEFPDAFNPSIIKTEGSYLMAFRYTPNRWIHPCLSYIGIVPLDASLTPTAKPQLLKVRPKYSKVLSQAEDPRLFTYKGRIFVIYNDNVEKRDPSPGDRRDMFIAELFYDKDQQSYSLSAPRKLIYEEKYKKALWQKNWLPFEYNGMMLFIYSITPHEILYFNFVNGSCYKHDLTDIQCSWSFGNLRGSTPPLLDEEEYFSFFHSSIVTSSPASFGCEMYFYFMGAYTFSATPPFQITKISAAPIIHDTFYTPSSFYKRVVFPGGCVISGDLMYVAYGKDDCEIWIATMDKAALKRSLIPVDPNIQNDNR
jgi:predicted GH43/DUF377 family glycosyl hydrolase